MPASLVLAFAPFLISGLAFTLLGIACLARLAWRRVGRGRL